MGRSQLLNHLIALQMEIRVLEDRPPNLEILTTIKVLLERKEEVEKELEEDRIKYD